MTIIGEDAFRDCSGLTSVTIPNSVTSIDSYALYGCKRLSTLTIDCDLRILYIRYPDEVRSLVIGDNLKVVTDKFESYTGIRWITICKRDVL